MFLRIAEFPGKVLRGNSIITSFTNDRTQELWRAFMPQYKSISAANAELYSVSLYPEEFFTTFDPLLTFEKWAAFEPTANDQPTDLMEELIIPAGKHAVFIHKGSSADDSTFRYIFSEWLPASKYLIDNRPHFEILGSKYINNNVDSEEEIWIPVREKRGVGLCVDSPKDVPRL